MFSDIKIPSLVYKIAIVAVFVTLIVFLFRTPTTEISPEPLNDLGIGTSTHLRVGTDGLSGAYGQLEEMNIHWIREEIPWSEVELNPGEFRFVYGFGNTYRDFNRMLVEAETHDLNVLAVLSTGPVYLPHQYPEQSVDSDQLLKRWQVYVQTVVDRFGDRINYWEIGNEINNPNQWAKVVFPTSQQATADPSPFLYARMLTTAYKIIKQHDSNDVVVLGGLLSSTNNNCNTSLYWYLGELRNAGAWDDFDIIAVHPYWENNPPEAWMYRGPAMDVESNLCQPDIPIQTNLLGEIEKISNFAAQYGAKPIWVTELGWREDWLTTLAAAQNVPTDQIESNFLIRSVVPLLANEDVRKVFWNSYYEDPGNPGFTLGPAGKQAFSNIARLLGGARILSDGKTSNQIGLETGVFEYRFRKEGRTIIYLWTASGGTTPYLVTLRDVPGKMYRAYVANTDDLSISSGIEIETNNSNLTLYINEIPVVLIQDNVNIFSSLNFRISDGLASWGEKQKDGLNNWANNQVEQVGNRVLNWSEKGIYRFMNWLVDQLGDQNG
ncbi:MAG: hypothetical protein CL609_09275 [Anaerolineaceae bacterium]|nr:hypothetical protein [Anaerolineaceae bacterium]